MEKAKTREAVQRSVIHSGEGKVACRRFLEK
jgi:hypothetical protein